MVQSEMFWSMEYVENMNNPLIIIDSNENIIFSNKIARRYFNIDLKESKDIKKYYSKILCMNIKDEPVNYDALPFIKILESNFKTKKDEMLLKYKSRYFKIEANIIKGNDKTKNISILIRDISKQINEKENIDERNEELTSLTKELIVKCALNSNLRKKEHELRTRLEEINRSNNDFFNFVSHELRTPLAIIISSIQLCKEVNKKEISTNIDKTLLRINQNARRLLKLVNNILDLTKANAGHITIENTSTEIVSFSEYIVDSVNTYAKVKNINIIFDTTHEEGIIDIDRDKYEKILLNLLSNAIKYSNDHTNIYVNLELHEDSFKVIVRDEGIGIPEDKIKYVFQRFTRIHSALSKEFEGTGLGLSLVQKLVELMNGSINVRSEVNVGSTFEVEFKSPVLCELNNEKILDYYGDIFNNINLEFSDVL